MPVSYTHLDVYKRQAFGGAYTREHFFGKTPETLALVSSLSDDDIWRLNRGGHDPHKVYAAYDAAVKTVGQPTVILAKTVKGYGMGSAGEALNPTHQTKKLDNDAVRAFRDRFQLPISDDPVSYTHLDVYKRQVLDWPAFAGVAQWQSCSFPSY